MFVNFFHELKRNSVPVSLRECLSLEALDAGVISGRLLLPLARRAGEGRA